MSNGAPVIAGYEVLEQLGSGATGTVHLARQISTGRLVAVKALSEQMLGRAGWLERFRSEARLMTQFDDEHLVNVYDYIETGSKAYLVMEYVPGVLLRDLLGRGERFTPEQALGVLDGALRGLAAAHRLGVVHGDVKPENVLVTPDGVSRLIDFGQASPVGSLPSGGTPAYASPEALRDERVDARSDVYAAGLLVYEMLTGKPPFSGHAPEVAAAHRDATVEPLRGVPGALADLVARSLAKSPEERPQSADAFLAELEVVATASYGRRWRRRASIAALVGGIAGATGGAVATTARTQPASGSADSARSLARHTVRLRRLASRGRAAASAHPVTTVAFGAVVLAAAVVPPLLSTSATLAGPFAATSISLGATGMSCERAHCMIDLGTSVLDIGPHGHSHLGQFPSTAGTVSNIACPETNWCVAVGSTPAGGGLALLSTDAGQRWTVTPVPAASGPLVAVSCAPGSRTCWATARGGIVHSAGGSSWRLQRAPPGLGGFGVISCDTTTTCVAFAGGSPVWTRDGGRVWRSEASLALLYGPAAVDCVTASTCWSVGAYTTSLQSQIGGVFRTDNGGATWTRVGIPSKPQPFGLNSVSCWSASGCLVDGTIELGGLESSQGTPYFLATSDGGVHWTARVAPETLPYVPALSCSSARRCVLAGRSGVGTTVNGGASWQPVYSTTFSVDALACTSRHGCFAAGSFPRMAKGHLGPFMVLNASPVGALARINRTGSTGSLEMTDRSSTKLVALSCADGERGARCLAIAVSATGVESLMSLRPAGPAPVRIRLPATPTSLEDVSCPSTSTCWVTGATASGPVLWRSTGRLWSSVPLPAGVQSAGSLSCMSARRCLLDGTAAGGPVLLEVAVTSGRPTWSLVVVPHTLLSLSTIECSETSVCWLAGTESSAAAGGVQAVTYRASDVAAATRDIRGGTTLGSSEYRGASSEAVASSTWTRQPLPAGLAMVSSVACRSASVCFAVGALSSGVEVVLSAGAGTQRLVGSLVPPTA